MIELAESMRKRAAELDLTHGQVARRAGLSERRFGNYVTGHRTPDLTTLIRIAEVLETTPDTLLGVGSPKKQTERDRLIEQIASAAKTLSKSELELLAKQAKALAKS